MMGILVHRFKRVGRVVNLEVKRSKEHSKRLSTDFEIALRGFEPKPKEEKFSPLLKVMEVLKYHERRYLPGLAEEPRPGSKKSTNTERKWE